MGRRGGLQAAENREKQLASAREALYAAAPLVAERLAAVAVGSDSVSSTDLQAMSSVLDRNLGRTAHIEVSTTMAQQTLEILRELDA